MPLGTQVATPPMMTSGCPLETASGLMSGRYQMKAASGEDFEAEIPLFLLESPYEHRQIH